MPVAAFAPLAFMADPVLFLIRLLVAAVMLYYGWPKIRNLKQNAEDFEQMGFSPGTVWGTAVAIIEFVGGLFLILGLFAWIAAALYGVQMMIGTVWKITKRMPFSQYSYDLLLIALVLVILTFGPGNLTTLT